MSRNYPNKGYSMLLHAVPVDAAADDDDGNNDD